MKSNGKKSSAAANQRQRSAARTLGPVASLEAHVHPEWWRSIFNGLYLQTDGDVVMDEELTAREIDLIDSVLQLSSSDRVLDLCCGQGRHTLELARRGYAGVEGLDRSHSLVQRARRSARASGLSVRFREGDARKLPHPDDSLDVVMLLGNSFGYFDNMEDDLLVLREVQRVLKPQGRILIDITDGEHLRKTFEPRAWEWIGQQAFVCRERSLSADGSRLISREIITHAERGVLADQFYAERLYSRPELLDLLERAGFGSAQVHAEINTNSQRGQDLGMMARRLLVSARAPDLTSPTTSGPVGLRQVVVVMGDPEAPDAVKPDSVFDDDDLDTIRQLKDALAELSGHEFTYLNRHTSLLQDLQSLDPAQTLVMNLCDEGLRNHARWELHVPALLEWLDLPYTGAGPQCLAYCYDKSLVRGVAEEMGIPVPQAVFLDPRDQSIEIPFAFPVIVKPNFGDSSVGITQNSVAHSPSELLTRLSELRQQFGFGTTFVVEEFLPGQDLSVGVIGNPADEYHILPIIQEDYSDLPPELPHICGYEAKWLPDSPYWGLRSIPAELPVATRTVLQEACLRLFERLECRDYARFDWRLDADGTPRLLEVNPNPGWCWDGHLAKMAALDGMTYADMLRQILAAAERRTRRDPHKLRQMY